jgi:hypothetical protein
MSQTDNKYEFGINEQKSIRILLEVIVCWGIHSLLEPGVGIPISKRVKTNVFRIGFSLSTEEDMHIN